MGKKENLPNNKLARLRQSDSEGMVFSFPIPVLQFL